MHCFDICVGVYFSDAAQGTAAAPAATKVAVKRTVSGTDP